MKAQGDKKINLVIRKAKVAIKLTYPWERLPAATFDLAAGSRSHIQYHLFILDNQIFTLRIFRFSFHQY